MPGAAFAAPLPLSAFAQLASSCAPHVAVETLAAVARTESGFDALTLHDNTTGRSYHPATSADAVALAVELATVARHSVDLGLMQINGANLPRLGLTLADAFDPCRNLAAADQVLVAGYAAPAPGADTQPAVQQALSRYNTGDPAHGLANGYVGRVQASAELVVPALRVHGDTPADQPAPARRRVADPGAAPAAPATKLGRLRAGQGRPRTGRRRVRGHARTLTGCRRSRGAPISHASMPPASAAPVPLQRVSTLEARADAR